MSTSKSNSNQFPISIAQMPITGDVRKNGNVIQNFMQVASDRGARLVQFPEGALSGYAKNPIKSWEEVNWSLVDSELQKILNLAKQLKIWVILGSAHRLSPPRWPHNSLYIISDEGCLVSRYDKRICSHTETTRFYTPGTEPVTFEVGGFRFGCLICIEVNFPQLFIEYQNLAIDCLLLSSYPEDSVFYTKACALAGIHNFWLALSIPTQRAHLMNSSLIGPNGIQISEVSEKEGVMVSHLDRSDKELEGWLNFARPWRASAFNDYLQREALSDHRSADRTVT